MEDVWCRRRESNPNRPFKPCGFSYHYGFRPGLRPVCGLDYPVPIPGRDEGNGNVLLVCRAVQRSMAS